MQICIKVIVLFAITSAMSLMIHKKINHAPIRCLMKCVLFYLNIPYMLLLLTEKYYPGEGGNDIFSLQIFVSEPRSIYLLCLAIFTTVSAIAPIVLKVLLQEKIEALISLSLSSIVSINTVVYLALGKVNDWKCFLFMVMGHVLSFLIVKLYRKEVGYCTSQNYRKRILRAIPPISFWIIFMVLYLPNELYLNNTSDMEIPYGNFLPAMLMGAAACFVIMLILFVWLLTDQQFTFICRIVFAITLAGYIQNVLLNGKMNIMDGVAQEWTLSTILFNVFIWLIIAGAIVFLPYLVKRKFDKIYSTICVYVSLILLVTWGYMGITSPPGTTDYYELTTEGRMELSSKHNVLVFVLDWYDAQIADKIFAQDPDFAEPLKDFTWYRNTTSSYAFTALSIPYLLTNVEWQYNMGDREYRDYAYQNSSYLRDIAEQDYDIGVYTYHYYLTKDMGDIVSNYSDRAEQGWNMTKIVEKMLRCSRYQSSPFLLKNRSWYYADSNFFMEMRVKDSATLNPSDDNQFYEELFQEGLHIRENDGQKGAFRFYHLVGAHPPFEPDMLTKGKNSLSMVFEYLTQLKDAGLYDEATVIITADHGHNHLDQERIDNFVETYDMQKPSSPILFVKESGQKNENGPVISMAPVSHMEMAATVMKAVSDGSMGYGETFSDIAENSYRERYLVFKWGDRYPYQKYLIQGDVRDWNNWHLQEQ